MDYAPWIFKSACILIAGRDESGQPYIQILDKEREITGDAVTIPLTEDAADAVGRALLRPSR